jgi:high affinity sulfate transporter 1
MTHKGSGLAKLSYLPPVRWLATYRLQWLPNDALAGVMLAAYAVPVSLAYAGLAGLPAQVGVYGYLLGGLGYALLGSSPHLAIGPTSAISLMLASTVAGMAGGDAERYAQIASLAAFTVAILCFLAWLLRLSVLVKLVNDSILVGFKTGAGLTIAITQLPALIGTQGGGQNSLERVVALTGQIGQVHYPTLAVGAAALILLKCGERLLPGKPVALVVVALSILAVNLFHLAAFGVATTGHIPPGLPTLQRPMLRLRDVDGIFPLAAGCLLLAYIESISAARALAAKHGYSIDVRQELLGIGAANLAAGLGHGYPVAGGLSQSVVNERAGARTQLSLIFASITLAISLLFLTTLLDDLPKATLAAIVLVAVAGLIDMRALVYMWRISRLDFYAAVTALSAVLVLGILQGILLAATASILLLLFRVSRPHVAYLGRIPGTNRYSDLLRHSENERLRAIIAFRPEASLLYVNADSVLESVLGRLGPSTRSDVNLVICDLSASPYIDLAGSRMLHDLYDALSARDISLRVVGAHGFVRDLLRADGLASKIGGLDRMVTLEHLLADDNDANGSLAAGDLGTGG